MVGVAFALTEGSFGDPAANVVFWGSAAAAVVATIVVLGRGPSELGWAAVGYIVFAALAAAQRPVPMLALLAVAYLPILERPKRSLPLGVAIAAGTALVVAVWARAIG